MVSGLLFHPQSPQAKVIAGLRRDILGLSAIVFVIVAGLVAVSLARTRRVGGQREPRWSVRSARIEAAWTIITVIVLGGLFPATVRAMCLDRCPLDPKGTPLPFMQRQCIGASLAWCWVESS